MKVNQQWNWEIQKISSLWPSTNDFAPYGPSPLMISSILFTWLTKQSSLYIIDMALTWLNNYQNAIYSLSFLSVKLWTLVSKAVFRPGIYNNIDIGFINQNSPSWSRGEDGQIPVTAGGFSLLLGTRPCGAWRCQCGTEETAVHASPAFRLYTIQFILHSSSLALQPVYKYIPPSSYETILTTI